MRFRSIAATLLMIACTSTLSAQDLPNSVCPAGAAPGGIPDQTRAAQDACQQAYDLYQFMAPQLGLALVGGSTTMGQGGALGGLGHFSIGIRGNVFRGEIPDVTNFTQSVNGAQRQTLPTDKQIIGLPTVDAAVGVFKGLPLALTNVGGIDILLNASYVPKIDQNGVEITPNGSWSFGYGARVGLLQESLVVPGVSVSYMKRDLPETDIFASTGSGLSTADLTVRKFKVETSAWRIMASKSLVLFSLHAGYGQETYDQSADISATVSQPPFSGNVAVPDTKQNLTRTNFFGGVALNLLVVKVVAEVGQVSGGDIATYNSFSGGRADRSLQYGSLGLRFGF
jgi:hypothetical protein